MSFARRLRRMQGNSATDWVGGVLSVAASKEGQGPRRIALWLQGGQVLGRREVRAQELDSDGGDDPVYVLLQVLVEVTKAKVMTHAAPDRIRVESPELAKLFRQFVPPYVVVVCGPTPELARWAKSQQYQTVGPQAAAALDFCDLASMERLATEIFELKPWFFLAPFSIFHLKVPALGLLDAAVMFMVERDGHTSVYVFEDRPKLEEAVRRQQALVFDTFPGCELRFERAELSADERAALKEAGWLTPVDDPTIRPLPRYREAGGAFRPLTQRESEVLRVGVFALLTMFGERTDHHDIDHVAMVGSWTVKLSNARTAQVELRWPADPEKGYAFFIPEDNEFYLSHRDRVLKRRLEKLGL